MTKNDYDTWEMKELRDRMSYPYPNELRDRLIYWAQNAEMIDVNYTQHGRDCMEAAITIGRLELSLAERGHQFCNFMHRDRALGSAMKFQLGVTGNSAMQNQHDLADALMNLAHRLRTASVEPGERQLFGVMDTNGNSVGVASLLVEDEDCEH